MVHIRRSKTDQEGVGRKVGIPHGRTRWCPVTALNDWLGRSGVEDGPVFRRVDRHGNLLRGRLSGEAVSLVIKARVAAVGLDPGRQTPDIGRPIDPRYRPATATRGR